jgi:ribonuclease P protein component
MAQQFGRDARLRQRSDYKHVEAAARRVSARFVTLLGRANGRTGDRLGIIASRRIGGAVARNRAKRRLRSLFRQREAGPGAALDIVAIAKAEIVRAPFAAVRSDFSAAWSKLRGAR